LILATTKLKYFFNLLVAKITFLFKMIVEDVKNFNQIRKQGREAALARPGFLGYWIFLGFSGSIFLRKLGFLGFSQVKIRLEKISKNLDFFS